MRSRLLRPPAAGTAYASSDDDDADEAETGSLFTKWAREIITLNVWLGPFRVPL